MVERFIISFIGAICLTLLITPLAIKFAKRFKILDRPDRNRKQHVRPVALLGGLPIFLVFTFLILANIGFLTDGNLEFKHWLGVILGALVLVVGGCIDDKKNLKPSLQIIFPIIASLCVIAGGVGIEKITNPFGGFLYLDQVSLPIISLGGHMFSITLFSDLLIAAWLLGMMYTTKLLDGIDGLVAGISGIGSLIIFLFTLTTKYYQPDIGLASLILAGCCLGFLAYNFNPAKIFLGEGGSVLLGFLLGVLSIISGGKIAIALLVMGIPVLDVIWTIIRRLLSGKSPFTADRKHLHFRIHDIGIGQKNTVYIYYGFTAFFGLSALFLQSKGKAIALVILVLIMLMSIAAFTILEKRFKNNTKQ